MRLDFITQPELAERWLVVDPETGEPLENVAWVDTDASTYATIKLRPKTMSDRPGTDLRVRDLFGNPVFLEREGRLDLVDRTASPLKAELLALLDEPDVKQKIRSITADQSPDETLDAG